jgi:hypothetical protein
MQPCLSGIVVAGNEEIFEIIFFLRFCKKKTKFIKNSTQPQNGMAERSYKPFHLVIEC